MKKSLFSIVCVLSVSAMSFAYEYTSINNPQSAGLRAILNGVKDLARQNEVCVRANDCPLGAFTYTYAQDAVLNLFDFVSTQYEFLTSEMSVTESRWSRGNLEELARYATRAMGRRAARTRISEGLTRLLETNYDVGKREDWYVYKYNVEDWLAHYNATAIAIAGYDSGEFVTIGYVPNLGR